MKTVFSLLLVSFIFVGKVTSQERWTQEQDGSLKWTVKQGEVHSDNIEMSGRFISLIATYGVDEKGRLQLSRQLVFPMLRTIPNDTHASLSYTFSSDAEPVIKINNRSVSVKPIAFSLRGLLTISGITDYNIKITRELFPSTDKPLAVEKYTIENSSEKDISVDIGEFEKLARSHKEKSFYGVYEISAKTIGSGIFVLKPGDKQTFAVMFTGRILTEPLIVADYEHELSKRIEFVDRMFNSMKFVSPDPVLNRMFDFAKIRSMESIFETRGGLVHSPGGGSYYAAIWANDQAEYANPFFSYTGYPTAISAGMNSWRWFSRYMNPEYSPIPSSIIAEGTDFWNGAGDRGDQAMIAYGAGRFALALGDKKSAEELWPLIQWCIEYCRRKINSDGVIASDSDELEGRFPSGKANLCTSSLFYDALISASYLGTDLGKSPELINTYREMAKELRKNIEKYFGATVNGYPTYRYYEGNDILRSWICIPLTVGIFERSRGTLDALFSKDLWTDQGLLTEAGSTTFWDRSTLYGLRGAFAAGETEKGLKYLDYYSTRRLQADHVPYAVEAWPEGNQRHLSAESALYCRVITEGIFGFRPTGLNSFSLNPQLPRNWNEMALRNIIAFGEKKIDIEIKRTPGGEKVTVFVNGKSVRAQNVNIGGKVDIKLPK